MSLPARGTRAAARSVRRTVQQQTSRRHASHGADHGHGHGHSEGAHHIAPNPGTGNESFGKGFYWTMALIPLGFLTYSLASSPNDNFVTKLQEQYRKNEESIGSQTVLHATMMDAALRDRALFKGATRDTAGPDHRFTEYGFLMVFQIGEVGASLIVGFLARSLNSCSPWNVSAGQGSADMSLLYEHFEEKFKDQEDARLARMENGRVRSVFEDKHENEPEVLRKQYRATK